eukprot:1623320-Amphidinium_carterae.1
MIDDRLLFLPAERTGTETTILLDLARQLRLKPLLKCEVTRVKRDKATSALDHDSTWGLPKQNAALPACSYVHVPRGVSGEQWAQSCCLTTRA